MLLPRNEYTRACARTAGRAESRAVRWPKEADRQLDEAYRWRSKALDWRDAWWCSVAAGAGVDAGRLTFRAVKMAILGSTFISGLFGGAIVGVCLGVYGIMYIGSKVLP